MLTTIIRWIDKLTIHLKKSLNARPMNIDNQKEFDKHVLPFINAVIEQCQKHNISAVTGFQISNSKTLTLIKSHFTMTSLDRLVLAHRILTEELVIKTPDLPEDIVPINEFLN